MWREIGKGLYGLILCMGVGQAVTNQLHLGFIQASSQGLNLSWDGVTAICVLIGLVTGLQTYYIGTVVDKKFKQNARHFITKPEFKLICEHCVKGKSLDTEGEDKYEE